MTDYILNVPTTSVNKIADSGWKAQKEIVSTSSPQKRRPISLPKRDAYLKTN